MYVQVAEERSWSRNLQGKGIMGALLSAMDRGVASPAPSYEVSISRTASPVACAGMADVVPC
jgi:hypothetical protein